MLLDVYADRDGPGGPRSPLSPVSEPAAFEEDVAAANGLDLAGFRAPEEVKQRNRDDCNYAENPPATTGWGGVGPVSAP